MEKVTWNKLVHQHSYFEHLTTEFVKSKPLNEVKIKIIIKWLEGLLERVRKEAGK